MTLMEASKDRSCALLLMCLGVCSSLAGCAPKIPILDQAGYYSSREREIRKSCDQEIYGRGVTIGGNVVYSYKERSELVQKTLKSNPQVLAAARQAYAEKKSVAIRNDIDVGGDLERDIKKIDADIKSCQISKGSTYRENLGQILRKSKKSL